MNIYDGNELTENFLSYEGHVKKLTEKAALLVLEEHGELWVPKSQIDGGDELEEGEVTTFLITQWFAEKEIE